jgi:cysteine desulfurase / selenocysteine lyase
MATISTFINERILPLFFSYNVEKVRKDFPFFNPKDNVKLWVYLDNAATSQKPQVVIDRLVKYYTEENSNIHRGVYKLSEVATDYYEGARKTIAAFIGAESEREIIFTSGATDGINMIAQAFGQTEIKAGDDILISEMEHHSNVIPWQMLAQRTGAILKVIPVTKEGELSIEKVERLITKKTKIIAIAHVSNTLGTINPVKTIIELAHEKNIPVLIDGAMAVCHMPVNVRELDADFYVFSGHKIGGPTGIGVLYGKEEHLQKLQPQKGGGGMIVEATNIDATYKKNPHGFEAGTPHIAGAIGLAEAVTYNSNIGLSHIAAYEQKLTHYAENKLFALEGVSRIGSPKNHIGILSFLVDGIHPHDIGTFLSERKIAIRSGHHCAMPLMNRLGVTGTLRASFSLYTTKKEIDVFVDGIQAAQDYFKNKVC